jgi:hypothetical protein
VGGLTLSVTAVEEQDRGRSDVKERTTFAKGTQLYLALQIQGKAGEVYTRFSQKTGGPGDLTDVKPHVTILDSTGKQVVSTDMEYG